MINLMNSTEQIFEQRLYFYGSVEDIEKIKDDDYKVGTVLINNKDELTYLKISDNIWEPIDTMTTTVSEPEITSGYNYNRMDLIETRCSACGAPIKIRSRYETIVKCEYCEMTYRFEPKKNI